MNDYKRKFIDAPRIPADPFARSVRMLTPCECLLLASQAPCECSHPGWDPTPQNPTPRDPPPGPPGLGGGEGRRGGGALRAPWAPSGPKGTVYTQRKLFRMVKSLKFRKWVKVVYSCHVSCRSLGVGLKGPTFARTSAPLQGQACFDLNVDRASAGIGLNI